MHVVSKGAAGAWAGGVWQVQAAVLQWQCKVHMLWMVSAPPARSKQGGFEGLTELLQEAPATPQPLRQPLLPPGVLRPPGAVLQVDNLRPSPATNRTWKNHQIFVFSAMGQACDSTSVAADQETARLYICESVIALVRRS